MRANAVEFARCRQESSDNTGTMSETITATATEPIIEARKLEKFYPQPDGNRIQVISPTDIAIIRDRLLHCWDHRDAENRRCCAC